MSTKTKLQLEMELKEAQATIAKLERDLQKARASGEEEQPTDKHPTKKPQREEDFLKLLEVLPVGVSILNHDRKVVFQNSALSQILDMTAEGIQAGAYKNRKYLASDGAAMPADGFASVQAEQSGQAVYNVETGIIQENGETIWTSVSAVPTDLPDWKTVIVTADVTERKLLEKRLFESEKRYTLLFEKSAVPSILLKFPEAVIVDVNEAGEKLTGFSKQEMFGKTAPELGLMKPQLRTEALSQFEKQGSLAGKEILIQAKSGEERIVISNTNPVTISGHSYAITTLLDITENKHVEKKLRENERIFNLFVEYSPAAIAMFDKDMHYLAASHRFAIDYGLPSYDIIGKSHYEVFPEIPERWKEIHRRCLAGAVEREEADPFPRADGSIDWVRWEIHPWYESEGKIGGIILFSEVITERIQLEQEQAKLNERLDLATRSAGIGIWDWDIKKNEIVWDDQMYALYGLSAGEFGGAYEAWLNGVHPEDQGPSNDVSAAAVRGEREYDTEFRVLWPDGSVHWLKANGQVFRDKNGTPLRMVGVNYDITERKQSEIALQESEEKYSALFAKSAIPAALTKVPEAVFVDINEAFQSVYGYSRADVIGKTSLEIGMALPAEHAQTASELGKHNFLRDNEKHLFTKAGEARIGSINVSKVKISGQDFVITTIHDITERKQLEVHLQKSERAYRELVQNANSAIIRWKNNGEISFFNEFAQSFFGYQKDEVTGKSVGILVPDSDSTGSDLSTLVQNIVENPDQFVNVVNENICKDGRRVWMAWTNKPIYGEDGQVNEILAVGVDISERKQAEDALRESESRLREAQRIAHIGNWEWNLQTGETRWSLENYAIHGISPDSPALTPDALIKFVHPDDLEMVNTIISQAISHGTSAELDYRIFRPNGSMRVIHAVGEVTKFDANGKPSLMLGTNQDITERKQVEDALWKSDQRFRAAIKPSFMVLAQTDLNARYTWIHNPHPDFDSDSVVGKTDIELADNDGTQMLYQSKLRVIATGQGIQTEISFPVSDGLRVYDVIIDPFYDVDGKLLGVTTSSYDITERKRVENALQQSQENFAKAFSSNPAALAITRNSDGKFIIVNDSYTSIMGYSESEIIGRNVTELSIYIDPNERGQLLRTLAEEGRVVNYELTVLTKNRTQHVLLVSMEPILYDMESCILSTFIDITERKLIEEELRRSNAELEQFAYIASHDLQEPLRALSGMVQLLQKRYQGQLDERADEYIRHAVDAASRMQSLIQALLSYSRAQRNNQPIELVDAGACLQIALKNLDASVQESHAVITADALPHVHANPAQLIQLFQNLIGNGIKFRGDEEPQIHISVTELKDAWQFSIRDNGIGIEPQYFERIFMIFQRLHTQREYSGTGIGLALCKKIIDRYGGRIWVESEPHRGSIFHFTLPLRSNS